MNKKPCNQCQLIVHSEALLNAKSPLPRLRATFLTPQSDFYIRSHEKFRNLTRRGGTMP